MQNVRPTDLAPAAEHLSPVSGAIDRVIAIAPAPLLPGEKQADYAERGSGDRQEPHSRGMRLRNFLSATSSISLGKFFAFGVSRLGF